jgi:ABC-type uncharacterized transport system auxiliary subunit
MRRRAWSLLGVTPLAACLFRSAEPPRFFRPVSTMLEAADADPRVADGVPIRLRDVHAEPFLRDRIVWRVSDVEYGSYAERRWLDLPAHYVERAVAARLDRTPGLRVTEDLAAPALRVNVLAFDDVLSPTHEADVALAVAVDDRARGPLLRRTFAARVAVENADPAALAKAMGAALDDAVAQVAEAVRESAPQPGPRSSRRRSAR